MYKELDIYEVTRVKELLSQRGPVESKIITPTVSQKKTPLYEGDSDIVPEGQYPAPIHAECAAVLKAMEVAGPDHPKVQDYLGKLGILNELETRDDMYYALKYIYIISSLRTFQWYRLEQKLVRISADENSILLNKSYSHKHEYYIWEDEMANSRRMTRERMMEIREFMESAFEKKHSNVE
ncbi:hypothetical protein A2803_00310 [Candidatus Woesebacteria bacterium RIFCSPHIGHO2_01_FULL_44_21]|uniref:Uncharacterized protein n=1 Tax=Candidatus Woesebacteria bacterium RIFCSPHIGHO2_01_FULL_44_21 TaxID=1802503 RepID=A0A1F7YWD0_9BACT|nr:MAG: hypothetical protein A2803_00310 [Candidatus Woesebacteria bacterium RIFCSPHIGHO2_01_FULL_44_21]OGM68913.1 MAG: hypothetical protein A2897_02005 [Candidatus Woesebacteria bacterium RIFCSPLOWO2_01_FULL_44_24b]